MNTKRKAELQRKLTLASVPKPPAGLAERIKSDIPKYLQPETDRARLRSSVAFNMRVAASILLVVTSVATAFFLLAPQEEMVSSIAPVTRAPQTAARSAAKDTSFGNIVTASQPTNEVQVEITQAAPPPQTRDDRARAQGESTQMVSRDRTNGSMAENKVENALREEVAFAPELEVGALDSVVSTPAAPAQVAEADLNAFPEPAPAPEVPMDIPAPAAAVAAPTEARRKAAVGRRAAAPAPAPVPVPPPTVAEPATAPPSLSLTSEAMAKKLDLGPRASVFGISVDPEVFHRIKSTIESGQRPRAANVNLEALVNYFAGPPAKPVRNGLRLEVEASPAVVAVEGADTILRFTVDTASAQIPNGASVPPIAKDAVVEVEFNEKAVLRAVPLGSDATIAPESSLLQNTSVTGLYAVELRSKPKATQRIATVRVRYTALPSGKKQTVEKTLYGDDFAKPWTRASRRHRLASLGALWGESLLKMSGGAEVARRAEELSSQDPADVRARELAVAATKTGSGR